MPYQKKRPDTLYQGHSRWLEVPADYQAKDGETVIEADEVVKKVPRQGFEITYLSYLFELFDRLAGKKYQVAKYILQNKTADNTLIITNRELAKRCGVGINTVTDTLKLLRDAGLIQTRVGSIMLNPKVAHRGSSQKEQFLLQKFVEFEDEEEEK